MSKTVILQPGTHCLVPVHASIVEQIKALKYVSPVVAVEIGYNRAIDEAVEILEKVRAINPTESDSSIVNSELFRLSGDDLMKFAAHVIERETPRIRAETLQDAAAYVLANAKIKNSCCAETRASIYTLIKGMAND